MLRYKGSPVSEIYAKGMPDSIVLIAKEFDVVKSAPITAIDFSKMTKFIILPKGSRTGEFVRYFNMLAENKRCGMVVLGEAGMVLYFVPHKDLLKLDKDAINSNQDIFSQNVYIKLQDS